MRPFDYVTPLDLNEAMTSLRERGSQPLAGGTDLLTLMKGDIHTPGRVVNIKEIAGLRGIIREQNTLRIGALTTLSDIEHDPLVRETLPALSEAASLAATPQLRNMATIAGNLLQRPRCWYYRNTNVDCWLKGGDACPMHDGENQFAAVFEQSACWAVHPSDLAPVLVALGAEVEVQTARGPWVQDVEDMLQPPHEGRRTESMLGEEDLITAVRVPLPAEGARMTYRKAMDRKVWAFALVGVAVMLQFDGDRVAAPSIVLGGVGNVPVRAHAAEEMLAGLRLDEGQARAVANAAFADATPLAHNGYKVRLGKSLLRQALLDLTRS